MTMSKGYGKVQRQIIDMLNQREAFALSELAKATDKARYNSTLRALAKLRGRKGERPGTAKGRARRKAKRRARQLAALKAREGL
ncbi:MAG TPA: hypothetical protein PLK84_00880 [Syntrophales bacterium]|nr:hypothetical protein [Syntrophales bacterium]